MNFPTVGCVAQPRAGSGDVSPRTYTLPWTAGDFVILTPTELLPKDETWINRNDMIGSFDALPEVVATISSAQMSVGT